MNAKDAIRINCDMSQHIVDAYLGDLEDADLLRRPAPGMHPIAWQLGHLIVGEHHMTDGIKPGSSSPLPEGFEAAHSKEAGQSDDTSKYLPKARYLELWKAQREATLKVLDAQSEADLDQPGPESFRSFCPTVGSVLALTGSHPLMHVGQWVIVRRQLGKPVVI